MTAIRSLRLLVSASIGCTAIACVSSSDSLVGEGATTGGPPGPRPDYGPTVQADPPPPPISGGTLAAINDDVAIASDPDRDRVLVADLFQGGVVSEIDLQPRDEPGRVALDDALRGHVVLRGGGAVASIDLATGTLIARRPVCAAPRGIAFDAKNARLLVACAGGEIVSLPPGGGDATTLSKIDRDLRDVVVTRSQGTYVTTFRTAEVLRIDDQGRVVSRTRPPDVRTNPDPESMPDGQANLAWRTIFAPPFALIMVHQRARSPNAPPVSTSAGGYSEGGGPCRLSIASTALTSFDLGTASPIAVPRGAVSAAVLPVDIAVSGDSAVVIAAGNGHTPDLRQVLGIDGWHEGFDGQCFDARRISQPQGQAIAAAFTPRGELVVQLREPSSLVLYDGDLIKHVVDLGGASREDTGHAIFHSNAGGFIACASCHAEGGEDGRTWAFDSVGPRRTQSLRGGVLGNGPYHWDGELPDLHALCKEVFSKRMSGADLEDDQEAALARWLAAIPSIPHSPPDDPAAVDRGRYVFADENVGCLKCHAGLTLTNHELHDVGTGGVFKVPSLRGVVWRAPYLHSGCAANLEARFDPSCGGGDKHGTTSQLSPGQVSDLIAFLQTL